MFRDTAYTLIVEGLVLGIFANTLIGMAIAASFSCQCFGGEGDFGSFDSDVNSGTDIAEDISPAKAPKPIYCDGGAKPQ